MSPRKPVRRSAPEQTKTCAADKSDSQASLSSGDRDVGRSICHYRIERKLGVGGMGEVYLATDVALGRQVALKVLPESYSPSLRERLLREAWASARLQHPAIATFYEAGEADGVAFIAMEYVAGRTLRDELDTGPIAFDRAVTMVCCILEALSHAHAAEILHRDIKPANIMCTEDGAAKLLDFGLAKHAVMDRTESKLRSGGINAADAVFPVAEETHVYAPESTLSQWKQLDSIGDLTEFGTVLGTLGYMSPEQLRGEPVDARTDIFAVGAVLYETLTGRPAFPGESVNHRIDAILYRDPPPMEVNDGSTKINAILSRSLAKDVASRFSSSAEFLTELRKTSLDQVRTALPNAIAVLDFENQSEDDRLDWLTTGLADAFALRLRSTTDLPVVPRGKIAELQQTVVGTSTELGLHLGCRWVISGRFQGTLEEVEVSTRLIDVPASTTYCERDACGPLDALFEMQESIIGDLTQSLQPGTSAPTSSRFGPTVQAYECYVRGRRELFKYEKAGFDRAFELLTRAVDLSPDYALALSGLAQLSGMRFTFTHDPQTLESAIEYAQRAIQGNSQLADPWVWLGYARGQQGFAQMDAGRDAESANTLAVAEQAMGRALELEPMHPMAAYFAAGFTQAGCRFAVDSDDRRARRTRALELLQRALEITPHSSWTWFGIGYVHLDLGNIVEARWCLEKAVELEPRVTPPTAGVAVFLGECLRRIGEIDLAREQCLRGLDSVEKTDHMYRDTFRGVGLCALGRTSLQLDDHEAARAAFRQAALHLRGRTRARIGGQLLVQALSGLTRCGEGSEPYEEAVTLFEARQDYEFGWLWWGWDEITLLQLSLAAEALGRTEEASQFLDAAIKYGSIEAEGIVTSRRNKTHTV